MLVQDPSCSKEPNYIWGVLQGAALGKMLGVTRISVIEFGVGGGTGLLALERIAERCEEMVNIGIDVYGFDTGSGLPLPRIIGIVRTCFLRVSLPLIGKP